MKAGDFADVVVRDLMTSDPITVTPEVSLERVLALMKEASIRHLPVVDEEGIVGMVTDRDLKFIHGIPGVFDGVESSDVEKALEAPIGVVLKSRFLVDRDVLAVDPQDTLATAVNLFLGTGMGALPVLDSEDEVIGILSVVDVLRWVADKVLPEEE